MNGATVAHERPGTDKERKQSGTTFALDRRPATMASSSSEDRACLRHACEPMSTF